MISPIIDVPTESNRPDVADDAKFEEPLTVNTHAMVGKYEKKDTTEFVKDYKDLSLTSDEKKELIDAANVEIEWVKRKLEYKLRKPMWQDENDPRSKEKLIRMFNNYVQVRLDLIKCLEEGQ